MIGVVVWLGRPEQTLYNTDALGYPTRGGKDAAGRPTGSSNFNLHRAVQSVMTQAEFTGDLHVTDAHVEAVARYVVVKQWQLLLGT